MTQTVKPQVAASSDERPRAGVFSQAHMLRRAIFASAVGTRLVGLLLASPIFIAALVTLLRPLVRATCPFELRLAFDNLSQCVLLTDPRLTGVAHNVININAFEFSFVEIELK